MVPNKKPAPDVYLWVLQQLGVKAADCIALEDSDNGLRAALAAGIRTYITRNAYTRGHALKARRRSSRTCRTCRASAAGGPAAARGVGLTHPTPQ
jgi:beta-phosphoglucomutase-like phosphatase (HAD superfamily)